MKRKLDAVSRVVPGVCVWLLVVTVSARGQSADPLRVDRDVVYREVAGQTLLLDVFRPAKEVALRPALLLIHGGGWRAGERTQLEPLARLAAGRGYVAATVSYRFAPEHVWPAPRDDVFAALQFLQSNAERYGIDPERIAAGGASAGGHLSLMLALRGSKAEPRSAVPLAISFFGPTDLRQEPRTELGKACNEALLGGPIAGREQEYRDASPIVHVSSGDGEVVTVHGTADELVPIAQARRLHGALAKAAVPNELHELEGEGHRLSPAASRRAMELAFAALERSFRPLGTNPTLALDFGAEQRGLLEFTDSSAWAIESRGSQSVLALIKARSDYKPQVRSPFNRALVKEAQFGDFVMDVRVKTTHRDYGHRDLCLFFGYQDESHFYYVHLGQKADPHAHSIFLVDGKPRRSIATRRTAGTPWDAHWHRVRIVRDVTSGKIEVYWDDLAKPVMEAVDTTFGRGRIGVGSFDDTGLFDVLRVYEPHS